MTTFVGAEYIIANVLIALKREYKEEMVTLEQLSEAGIYIQQQSLDKNINAIFLTSFEQVTSAIYDFSDYFEFDSVNNAIRLVQDKEVTDLESRFMGYLPVKVLCFLVESLKEFVEEKGR